MEIYSSWEASKKLDIKPGATLTRSSSKKEILIALKITLNRKHFRHFTSSRKVFFQQQKISIFIIFLLGKSFIFCSRKNKGKRRRMKKG
jgi:hypothetical protein